MLIILNALSFASQLCVKICGPSTSIQVP